MVKQKLADPSRLRADQINPDGIAFAVNWDKFRKGSSVFFPCVDTITAITQVRRLAMVRKWNVNYRVQIEKGRWRVRFWLLG